MNVKTLLLVLISVSLSAVAQIILKSGMSSDRVQQRLASVAGRLDAILAVSTEPLVLMGLGLYGVGALVWLLVLAKLDVTVAYPFVGFGFILTMLLGWLVIGETVGLQRVIGTVLISVGVILVARTA